jgi:hypothetical protein
MKPMTSRSFGGVSALQMRDGRTKGAAVRIDALLRNDRRLLFMGHLTLHVGTAV